MPELPEVETVCRGLNQLTLQQTIEGGEVLLASTLAYPPSSSAFFEALSGTRFHQWERRGKYLLARLTNERGDPAGWLGVHLRMTGQLLWVERDRPLSPHTRARLFCGGGRELRFVDIRTFGRVWWVPPECEPAEIVTGLRSLGPEPFSSEFSSEYLVNYCRRRSQAVKSLLLDQRLVAGLGNIYADEALFHAGIAPTTPAREVTPDLLERLRASILKVLEAAIAAGGTTFSDFRGVTGINGNYGGEAWVYGRKGQPCRICGTAIERVKLGGRSSHFCPACQAPVAR